MESQIRTFTCRKCGNILSEKCFFETRRATGNRRKPASPTPVLSRPVLLACGHSVCDRCIVRKGKEPKDGGDTEPSMDHKLFTCPLEACKKDTNVGASWCSSLPSHKYLMGLLAVCSYEAEIKSNRVLELLNKSTKATSPPSAPQRKLCVNCNRSAATLHCEQCNFSLCDVCFNDIHSAPIMKSHKALLLKGTIDTCNQYCEAHATRPLEYFCRLCSAAICSHCATIGEHRGHDICSLEEANADAKLALPQSLAQTQQVLQVALESRKMISKERLKYPLESSVAACSQIEDCFLQAHGLLQQLEQQLIQEVTKVDHEHEEVLNKLDAQLGQMIEGLQQFITDAQHVVTGPNVSQHLNLPKMIETATKLLQAPCKFVQEEVEACRTIRVELNLAALENIKDIVSVEQSDRRTSNTCRYLLMKMEEPNPILAGCSPESAMQTHSATEAIMAAEHPAGGSACSVRTGVLTSDLSVDIVHDCLESLASGICGTPTMKSFSTSHSQPLSSLNVLTSAHPKAVPPYVSETNCEGKVMTDSRGVALAPSQSYQGDKHSNRNASGQYYEESNGIGTSLWYPERPCASRKEYPITRLHPVHHSSVAQSYPRHPSQGHHPSLEYLANHSQTFPSSELFHKPYLEAHPPYLPTELGYQYNERSSLEKEHPLNKSCRAGSTIPPLSIHTSGVNQMGARSACNPRGWTPAIVALDSKDRTMYLPDHGFQSSPIYTEKELLACKYPRGPPQSHSVGGPEGLDKQYTLEADPRPPCRDARLYNPHFTCDPNFRVISDVIASQGGSSGRGHWRHMTPRGAGRARCKANGDKTAKLKPKANMTAKSQGFERDQAIAELKDTLTHMVVTNQRLGEQLQDPLPIEVWPARVHVTHIVSPAEFYVRLYESEESAAKRQSEYNGYCAKQQSVGDVSGCHYLLGLDVDGNWKRIQVLHANGSSINVVFVDVGQIGELHPEDLRLMPSHILDRPKAAIRCHLHGIQPLNADKQWDNEVAIEMREQLTLASKTDLVSAGVPSDGDSLAVDILLHHDTPKPLSLRDHLIFINLAIHEYLRSDVDRAARQKFLLRSPFRVQDELAVQITHCTSPSRLFAHVVRKFTPGELEEKGPADAEFLALAKIADDMNRKYAETYSSEVHKVIAPHVGCGVAACYQGGWYRAEIIQIAPHRLRVRYVDYGNEEWVTPSETRVLPDEFRRLPAQAVHFSVYGIRPGASAWSEEVTRLLEELCYQKICTVKVMGEEQMSGETGLPVVVVIKETGENLGDLLVSTGLAQRAIQEVSAAEGSQCFCTHVVSPGEIYLQSEQDSVRLSEITDGLVVSKPTEPPDWIQGDWCILKRPANVYRGVIKEIGQTKAKVHLVDTGATLSVGLSDIYPICDSLRDLPCCCFRAHIEGIRPTGGSSEWGATACELIVEMLQQAKNCQVIPKGPSGASLPCDIMIPVELPSVVRGIDPPIEYVSVRTRLLDSGVALREGFSEPSRLTTDLP